MSGNGETSSAQGASMPDRPPAAMEDSEGVQGGPETVTGDPDVQADPQTGGEPGASADAHADRSDGPDEVLEPGGDDSTPHRS